MSLVRLFLSLDGRIGRLRWWLGTVAVEALSSLFEAVLGVPLNGEPAGLRLRAVGFAIGLLTLYPTAALGTKRLHDRDQPGTLVWLLVAASAVSLLADLTGFLGEARPMTASKFLVSAVVAVVEIAFLIELGLRRGTRGANAYGPDPAAGRVADVPAA